MRVCFAEGLNEILSRRVPVVVGSMALGQVGRVGVVVPAKVTRPVVIEMRVSVDEAVGRWVELPLVAVGLAPKCGIVC